MAPQVPSIQSFFQPEVPSSPSTLKHSTNNPGDGFTSSEIEIALHPTLHQWQPRTDYEELNLGSLNPGPKCVLLVGRIANFYDQPTASKMPQAANGCLKITLKDDTGAIVVSEDSLSNRLLY